MYLKRIEMRGFKSFADKTIVEFRDGVTCVVGPNGSGKSNITDAMRWVLGEQRAKTLRGNKMEDVIFNGTKHRKPLGLAEVKLVFDNSEQFFPLEFDEIEVIRRVHRSGESEYLINSMPCRLKDVRELFMDTGIGREGYSIIGQGRIDEILSSNRDERRLLFEEAAGIIKYKTRKSESERKLKTTTDNLVRIEDILSEIETRVGPLKKESQRAEKYLALNDQLKQIEINVFSRRYVASENNLNKIIEAYDENTQSMKDIEAKKTRLQESYNEKDQSLYRVNRELRLLEESYHEHVNLKSTTKGEREVIAEKIQNVERNVSRLNEEVADINRQKEEISSALQTLEKEYEASKTDYETLQKQMDDLNQALTKKQNEVADIRSSSDTERQAIFAMLNDVEVKKSEIQNFNRFKQSLNVKIEELKDQIESFEEKKKHLEEEKISHDKIIEDYQSTLDKNHEALAKLLEHAKYLKKEQESKRLEANRLSQTISENTTEKKLLETLEQEYDGYDKGVKDILMNLPDQTGIHGIVASIIEVPKKVEKAIEVALGRSIQHIVCEKASDAKRSIEYLRKNKLGRVTFLPLNQIESNGQQNAVIKEARKIKGFLGVGSDLISFDESYQILIEYLLGRVMIVDSFDTAQKCLQIKNIKYKVITLDGDVLIPGGTITGGSFKSRVSNILGRKRRINELESLLKEDEQTFNQCQKDFDQLSQSLEENEKALKQTRESIDESNMLLVKAKNSQENHVFNLKNMVDNADKMRRDYEVLLAERDETDADILKKEGQIKDNDEKIKALESKMSDVKQVIESEEKEMEALSAKVTSEKIKYASLEQSLSFKNREILRMKDDLETVTQKLSNRQQEIERNHTTKDDFYKKVESIDESIEDIQKKIKTIEEKIEGFNSDKEKLTASVKDDYRLIADCSKQLDKLKEARHQLELKRAKIEVEKEAIVTDLWERYEITIGEALQIEDAGGTATEMKAIKSEIKSIGTVNLNAIEEYKEVSERHLFLKTQQEDLLQGINDLKTIILDLEKKMTEQFKAHFDMIGEHFKETFRMLFNGGDAELILADYDDILNCDIDISAQPPGKKLQNINLLSGGEKALTAIALLFAILRTKPTPFCILDEIEAALDDVNVYRFADFIKEYAANSQFVVITHRKGTMEIADTLYGVTMEEYGISKVLSVRFEDVKDVYN